MKTMKKLWDAAKNLLSDSKNSQSIQVTNNEVPEKVDNEPYAYYAVEADESCLDLDTPYPVYGMVTKILDSVTHDLEIVISNNILAHVNLPKDKLAEQIEIIKRKAFEPGVFWINFTRISPDPENKYPYEGVCSQILFNNSTESISH